MRTRLLISTVAGLMLAAAVTVLLPRFGETGGRPRMFSPVLAVPSGPYDVGVRRMRLSAAARADPWRLGERRNVMVDVHYPAKAGRWPLAYYAVAQDMTELGSLAWAPTVEARLGLRHDDVNWLFRTHSHASTRWAWALGFPLGISDKLWEEGKEDHLWLFGAALATMGALGSLLTLGLVQRWGEIFPWWMVGLRGRRVPMFLAIVPATLVAVMVTIAGVMYIRLHFQGAFDNQKDDWGATVPEMIWPVWGIALAAATLAYYFRRRGACKRCARG